MVARRSHTEFAAEFPCHELDPHKVSLAFIPPGSPGVCVHGREQLMPRLYPTHTLISATLPPRSVTWARSRPPCSTASQSPSSLRPLPQSSLPSSHRCSHPYLLLHLPCNVLCTGAPLPWLVPPQTQHMVGWRRQEHHPVRPHVARPPMYTTALCSSSHSSYAV